MELMIGVKRDTVKHLSHEEIALNMMRSFPSMEYLKGWCEGYGFGKMHVFSIQDIEAKSKHRQLDEWMLFAVSVEDLEDTD